MIYFFTIFILLVLIRVYDFGNIKKSKNEWYYFVLVILILTAGFRYRIGLDTIRYMSAFEDIPTLFNLRMIDFEEARYDPIYYLLSVISKTIYPDFVFFQIVHAIILNSIVFFFIKKNTSYIFTAVFLYYVFCFTNFNFEVMRESIAVSFFLLAADSLFHRKWIKYYLLAFVGFLCHSSAIILFIVPIFLLLSITKWTYLYMGVIYILSILISEYIETFFKLISITESLSNKADSYLESELMGQVYNIFGKIKNFIIFIFFPLIAISFLKRNLGFKFKYEFLVIANIFVAIMAMKFGLFYRYFNYFILFDIILFSEFGGSLSQSVSSKYSSVLVLFSFSCILFLQVYSYFSSVGNYNNNVKVYARYYPYSSVIDKEKDDNREWLFRYHDAY